MKIKFVIVFAVSVIFSCGRGTELSVEVDSALHVEREVAEKAGVTVNDTTDRVRLL